MASAIDLTTLQGVEAFLPLPAGNSDEAILASLITGASQFIATYCGRVFQQGSYAEARNGTGAAILTLKRKPIVAIASLTIGTRAIPPSTGVTVHGYLYDLAGDESACRVYLRGYRFERGIQNVAIAYTAGYATIPADLAQACNELVALRYRERAHFDLASKGMAGETTTFIVKDMKASTQDVLDFYRRKVPGWP